jgi:hypothetical protein
LKFQGHAEHFCVGSANWRDSQLRFSMSKSCIRVKCFAVAIMGSVAHACNGNHSANVKLLKLGSVLSIQVANFRDVCEISELCSGIC